MKIQLSKVKILRKNNPDVLTKSDVPEKLEILTFSLEPLEEELDDPKEPNEYKTMQQPMDVDETKKQERIVLPKYLSNLDQSQKTEERKAPQDSTNEYSKIQSELNIESRRLYKFQIKNYDKNHFVNEQKDFVLNKSNGDPNPYLLFYMDDVLNKVYFCSVKIVLSSLNTYKQIPYVISPFCKYLSLSFIIVLYYSINI